MPDYPLPNFSIDLSGRTALVTGASAGLGWRFAQTLAACGARVAVAARRRERLDELVATIRARGGVAEAFEADLTKAEELDPLVDKAEAALGLVDILVNNAGIPDAQRATKMDLALIDRLLNLNVRAPFMLSCAVARKLIAAKKPGRIVNISSMAAYRYDGNGAALYATTKGAVVRMTEALAVEWAAFNINVNAIAPGVFNSEMTDGMLQRMGDLAGNFPRKRLGDAEQIDLTLLYLVSPATDFVTGTVIKIEDGQGAKRSGG